MFASTVPELRPLFLPSEPIARRRVAANFTIFRAMGHLVAPSLLACDFARLGEEVDMLNKSVADWIHVDVMDGVFVPNISIGIPVVEAVSRRAAKPLDVHLMVADPSRYLEDFKNAGASIISVHIEADHHLHRTINRIKELGCKAGVAINPHTPPGGIEYLIELLDVICVMAVNPGFGGQLLIESVYTKVETLRKMTEKINPHARIEVDGGVNMENAGSLLAAGADVLVAGHFVFCAPDPMQAIAALRAVRRA